MSYLHCIDLSDKLKCLNIASTRTISSLLTMQLFNNDSKPNPMNVDIERLKDCTAEEVNGMSSPRMYYIFQRTILNQLQRQLTPQETSIVKKGDLEIEFERARREYNYGAPSRLSCLYLVEDNQDGRTLLGNMFRGFFRSPMILEVKLLNKMEIVKCDTGWIDAYIENPQEEYIKNYWTEIPFNGNTGNWEYLLEGTIRVTNKDQQAKIIEHVRQNYPAEYNEIINFRKEG